MRSWPTWRRSDGKPLARCRPGTWPGSGPGASGGATPRKPPGTLRSCAGRLPAPPAPDRADPAKTWPGGSRPSAIPGAARRHRYPWTAEEVRLVLDQIDRQSAIGKRDYAMVLLTARLGLRVGDLRRLELGWFDWRAKTLALTQHKTGLPLRLPRAGRRRMGGDRLHPPRPARSRMCAGVRQAPLPVHGVRLVVVGGLPAPAITRGAPGSCSRPGRSHGLHSLRGALAVAMLQADTPPPVVTAVLGHAAATTTAAHYLRLDTEHLRRCALDVEDVLAAGQGARS